MRLFLLVAFVACACAYDHDIQAVKSVKGGHGSNYQGGDISRFYNNQTNQHGGYNHTSNGGRPGQVPALNFEIGVCYIEVPTANLVLDKSHIPAGNGSRPDLSRIRTCCKGYARNVYNFRICEPVCSQDCVNSLCTAPDTCTCYPDHVRNQFGACVATCPIGCQNGHCDGGECLCKEGFRLDVEGRFCLPICRNNCGGVGNCTAPNTCTCSNGHQPTPDGSCQVSCGKCENGDCVSPTECRCRPGYVKDSKGLCVEYCSQSSACSYTPGQRPKPPQQTNSQNPYGPGQNNNYYYNPNQGSNYPLYPYNHNGPQQTNPSSPNQGSSYPQTNSTHPQQGQTQPNPYYPQHGSGYPQPNPIQPHGSQQGHNYPPTNSNSSLSGFGNSQVNQNQQHPQPNPIHQNYPQTPYGQNQLNNSIDQGIAQYPNRPNQGYPQNPNQPNHGYPQYPNQPNQGYPQYPNQPNQGYPQYPNQPNQGYPQHPNQPNQGSFQPISQTFNITYPNPYPLYPDNQLGPNRTNPSNYPDQHNPDLSRPGPNHHGFYPQYPSTGANQNNYPSQQHGYYNQGYPGYQGPDNQYPYDQTQESSLCSEPCIHGTCIDHNRCRCHPGYVTDEMDPTGNKCRPHCPGGCPNGYCVGPHSCACDEGYYRDSSVKGRPSCVKRIRRSLGLIFNIPDYADQ